MMSTFFKTNPRLTSFVQQILPSALVVLLTACSNGLISEEDITTYVQANQAVKLSEIVKVPFTSVHAVGVYTTELRCGCPDSGGINATLHLSPFDVEGAYRLVIVTEDGIHTSEFGGPGPERFIFERDAQSLLDPVYPSTVQLVPSGKRVETKVNKAKPGALSVSIEPSDCVSAKEALIVRVRQGNQDVLFLGRRKGTDRSWSKKNVFGQERK